MQAPSLTRCCLGRSVGISGASPTSTSSDAATYRYSRRLPSPHSRLPRRCCIARALGGSGKEVDLDVVVVGAGIVGLMTAKAMLDEGLSVALVERRELCAGATGAGQGYVWMSHRSPMTAAWELASFSVDSWRQLVQVEPELRAKTEWETTGSLLLASNPKEAEQLQERHGILQQHGVESSFLDAAQVKELEPALSLPQDGAGLVARLDAQINGRRAASFMLEWCQSNPLFMSSLNDPVHRILLRDAAASSSHGSSWRASVETSERCYRGRLGVVVAAGAWSGQLVSMATGEAQWERVFQPQRGHLLELVPPQSMPPISHGMMEVSYAKHYAAASTRGTESSSSSSSSSSADITFTATRSASGTLLIGSSREFCGFGSEPSSSVVQSIMHRAAQFLPHVGECSLPTGAAVRVGPRPHAAGGLPVIGPVPGAGGLFVAAGHDGSGLTLGPATAQLIKMHMMGSSNFMIESWSQFMPINRLK